MCGTRLALLVRFTPMRNPVSTEVNNLLGDDITCCPPTSVHVHTQRNTQERMQKIIKPNWLTSNKQKIYIHFLRLISER